MRKAKAQRVEQLRIELKAAYQFFRDQQKILEDEWDDTDAESLEYMAHRMQGMYLQLEKVEDLTGGLALEIDPKILEKMERA